jgi:hypothetical protein
VTNERFVPTAGGRAIVREDFGAHGRALLAQYQSTRNSLLSTDDTAMTREVIVQITTPPEIPVRQEKQRLRGLGFEVLSYPPRTENRANTIIAKADFDRLQQRLLRYAEDPRHPGKSLLAAIEEISEVPAEDKVDPMVLERGAHVSVSCIVTIYAALPTQEKVAIAQALSRRLSAQPRGITRIRSFANETMAIAAKLTAEEALDLAGRYASIRSIQPNGQTVITRSIPISALPANLRIAPLQSQTPVVIIDSGIGSSGPLRGLVIASRAQLPAGSARPELSHGTFVASRLTFGDDLDTALATGVITPQCPLIDVAVVGVDAAGVPLGPEEDELIDIVQRTVNEFRGQARVFNLSLGFDAPIQDGTFSELAKNLDYLARENDILFVIAAGNIVSPASPYPDHFLDATARIQPPAEALLALSVGAFAKHTDPGALSAIGEVSPFTCRGPGADLGQKPEVVAHGGNVLATWSATPRIATYGLSESGTDLAYAVGTSYAAPLVAQSAARLGIEYPSASTNLLKALLCHFSSPVSSPALAALDSRYLTGVGCPELDLALHAGAHSVGYLYEGKTSVNSYQHVPFFVPATLAENTNRSLRIAATLVYNPPVDPDNSAEYSRARISCSLYKRVDVGFRQVPISASDGAIAKPWNPFVHFTKVFRRQYATGDWEIRLRLMTRGMPDTYEQSYALVIEVIDDSNTTDVRQDILAESPEAVRIVGLRTAA